MIWVLEGDRGPQAAGWLLHGAVAPAEWAGLLVPGRWADASRMVYLESLFLGPPLILCGLLGAWRRKWLLAAAAGFCVLATLPEVGGGELLLALTGGLVRYPSRFALVGLAMLLPMIGVGTGPWIEGKGRWLAVSVSALGLVLCAVSSHPLRWWIAGLPAVLTLLGGAVPAWRRVRAAALAAGLGVSGRWAI